MGKPTTEAALPDRRQILARVLALLALLAPGVAWFPAEAATPAEHVLHAAGLLLRAGPGAEPVEALRVNSDYRVRITGSLARVQLTQRFANPSDDWLEGLFVFPLSDAAAVDQLEMQVGERLVRGEIRPKKAAQAAYRQARREGRRASLVDQQRPNMFTTAVANIAPRSEITIRIAYLELIPWRDERYALKLPLAITPRYTPGEALHPMASPERVTAPAQAVSVEVELAPGFALASLESLHHAVSTTDHGPGNRVTLLGEQVPADRDFELAWKPVISPDTQAALFTEAFDGETFALLTLAPPESPPGEPPRRELLFIIDTSGSMGGAPIRQARAALQFGVDRLGPEDRFDIIRFSSDASRLFGEPQAAGPVARAAARRYIGSLKASGGTEMRAALELALGMPPSVDALRQLVFITDGSVSNEAELVAMIGQQIGEARLFTVGIGAAPNAWFMHGAAAAGRGSYTYIAQAQQVSERMAELFRKLERPALVELELHWPGRQQAELAAPLPRDLYAGDPLVVAARLGARPAGVLTLAGQSRNGAWVHQLAVTPGVNESGIAKLWARERIAELSRQKRLQGASGPGSAHFDAAILELALRHGLVSELTSLVAVDVTPVRPAGLADRLEQAVTSAPAGTGWARSAGFAATATPAARLLRAGLAWVAAAVLLMLWNRTRWRLAWGRG